MDEYVNHVHKRGKKKLCDKKKAEKIGRIFNELGRKSRTE